MAMAFQIQSNPSFPPGACSAARSGRAVLMTHGDGWPPFSTVFLLTHLVQRRQKTKKRDPYSSFMETQAHTQQCLIWSQLMERICWNHQAYCYKENNRYWQHCLIRVPRVKLKPYVHPTRHRLWMDVYVNKGFAKLCYHFLPLALQLLGQVHQ